MTVKLPKAEVYVYFITWITSFIVAFYQIYQLGLSYENFKVDDFINGWTILQRRKDSSDDEWELWTNFSFQMSPWLIFHLVISEIIRHLSIESIPLSYMVITLLALLYYFPPVIPAFLIIQLSLFFVGMLTSSKIVIWILGIFFLFFICCCKDIFMEISRMNNEQFQLSSVLIAWFLIRCIDFALSEIKEDTKNWPRFLNLLAYTFYLPCFFFGPFIPYDYFKLQVYKTQHLSYKERIFNLCYSLLKYCCYYLFFDFLTHFLYCHAMHYDINFIKNEILTLSGIGLCMANFFYLKYIIIYGFAASIANCENFETPAQPKCIFRIHLYSDLWRHFDRGFYLFIFRCIYSPACKMKNASLYRKSFASFLCFLFVFIWHGGTVSVFYWSSFNFCGLICESIFRKLCKNDFIHKWLISNVSQENLRRLEALVASPLWILAVISNIMFFCGHNMGMVLIKQFIKSSVLVYIIVTVIAYCMCQVSIEITSFENKTNSNITERKNKD